MCQLFFHCILVFTCLCHTYKDYIRFDTDSLILLIIIQRWPFASCVMKRIPILKRCGLNYGMGYVTIQDVPLGLLHHQICPCPGSTFQPTRLPQAVYMDVCQDPSGSLKFIPFCFQTSHHNVFKLVLL